jgi:uncharacterized protein (TIGR03000 family)
VRRIPLLVALVLSLSAVSARGQSRLTEGGIPVPPPSNSWSDSYRPVSGGPAEVTVLAPTPAVVYVPVYVTAPAPAAAPATVVVRLPADARLTFDGAPTRSTGATRTFQSPPLGAGAAGQYVLRAEIVRDGRALSVRYRVQVRAGTVSEVRLDPEAFRVASR